MAYCTRMFHKSLLVVTKKAHRHAAGTHVHAIDGEGYTLLWYEGESEFKEIPWRHGVMYTPPFWMFHQHFNTAPAPARYVACSLGSRRYPWFLCDARARKAWAPFLCNAAADRSNTKIRILASIASGCRRLRGRVSCRRWAMYSTSPRFWLCPKTNLQASSERRTR